MTRSAVYDPERSRELAEKAGGSHGSAQERDAARHDFEDYHSAERMALLAAEVGVLRDLLEQARRIRYLPDVGYVDVRHVFAAVRDVDAPRSAPIDPVIPISI
jgi:hypothetical protein